MTFTIIIAAIALLVIDCLQTRYIFAHGRGEWNPVIRWAYARWGQRGVDGYFAAWVAGVALFHVCVPYGFAGSAVIALIEAVVVIRNHRHGIRP